MPPRTFQPPSRVLLSPGPVTISQNVREALNHADLCHREPDFSNLLEKVSAKLRTIFKGDPGTSVLLLTGCGTLAAEAAISSSVPSGKKILILENGAFGARLAEISETHRMNVVRLRWDLGKTMTLDEVRQTLSANPDIAVVAMVHHETSVGILNPIHEVGRLCRERDLLFLVDAVSSLGIEDLDMERDKIDLCWSTGCKGLHGVPGVAFLCAAPRIWPHLESISPRVYSLDLKRYRDYALQRRQTPFTPAVPAIFALEKACDEYLAEGGLARQQRYRERNLRLREGLLRLGLEPFSKTGFESHSLVTAQLPFGMTFPMLDERLRGAGFIVYDCRPPLQNRYFQAAHMGDLADADLDRFIDLMAAIVEENSYEKPRAVSL